MTGRCQRCSTECDRSRNRKLAATVPLIVSVLGCGCRRRRRSAHRSVYSGYPRHSATCCASVVRPPDRLGWRMVIAGRQGAQNCNVPFCSKGPIATRPTGPAAACTPETDSRQIRAKASTEPVALSVPNNTVNGSQTCGTRRSDPLQTPPTKALHSPLSRRLHAT
jgi:hypothetical protein